ncbi:ArsR family transcriptional regulator, partial [Sphaerisporangium sp. NPDC088356]
SRLVRDVGELVTGAAKARRKAATFAIDGQVRFASAAHSAAFADDLADAFTALVRAYHDETAGAGRDHHVIVAVHPWAGDEPDDNDTLETQTKEL